MTTFQGIVMAIVSGFTAVLPVGQSAHIWGLPYIFDWSTPHPVITGILSLSTLIAILLYFRHDWASIISSGLRVVLLWKKPMTLDERMPLFLTISSLPAILFWQTLEPVIQVPMTAYWIGGSLILFCLPLWMGQRMNRKTKNMFSWNSIDALLIGISQITYFIPGAGRQIGVLAVCFFRNYISDAAAKYTFLSFAPILAYQAYLSLSPYSIDRHSLEEIGISQMTFWLTFIVCTLSSLLAIGGFMRNLQHKGLGGYLIYRILIAGSLLITFWVRS